MGRIEEKFKQLKKEKKKGLIIFLTAGYPSLRMTEQLVYRMQDWGVDLIELGVPFSDPIADGPSIQYSSQVALNQGVSLNRIFTLSAKLRKKVDLPLILMSYCNPLYQQNNFSQKVRKAGFDGIIIPDLPPEEGRAMARQARHQGLDLIYLLAPTSNESRIALINAQSRGFIYVVSLTGVTGARKELPPDIKSFLKKIRTHTDKPLALGFGISLPTQVLVVKDYIDAVIVGSAVIEIIRKEKNPFLKLKNFIKNLNLKL